MTINKLLFKALLLFVFCFCQIENVFAIGMVTDPIIIQDILRGQEIMKTVTVLNPEKTEAMFSFGSDGDILGWVTFFETSDLKTEITQVVVPPGAYYNVIAKIKVPVSMANGQYNGSIYVKQNPPSDQQTENTVSIAQMVSREVRLTVSDNEIIDLKTTLIPEKYDLAKGEPLKIRIIYDNNGNISLKPSLQIKITNLETEKVVLNAIFPYQDTEEAVMPGERKEMPVFEWQTISEPKARYNIEVQTLINNEKIEENSFKFNLGSSKIGLKNSKFLSSVAVIGGGNLFLAWFIIGFIFLALAGLLFFINKKKIINKIKTLNCD